MSTVQYRQTDCPPKAIRTAAIWRPLGDERIALYIPFSPVRGRRFARNWLKGVCGSRTRADWDGQYWRIAHTHLRAVSRALLELPEHEHSALIHCQFTEKTYCTDKCWNAKSDPQECDCGGCAAENHGTGIPWSGIPVDVGDQQMNIDQRPYWRTHNLRLWVNSEGTNI